MRSVQAENCTKIETRILSNFRYPRYPSRAAFLTKKTGHLPGKKRSQPDEYSMPAAARLSLVSKDSENAAEGFVDFNRGGCGTEAETETRIDNFFGKSHG
jgi:hypothetical protein